MALSCYEHIESVSVVLSQLRDVLHTAVGNENIWQLQHCGVIGSVEVNVEVTNTKNWHSINSDPL